MSSWIAAAVGAALLLQQAVPATPDAAAPASEAPTVESLTVTAARTPPEEAIRAFVAAVSSDTANRRLGRWDRKICPGVDGMREDYARALLDRIAVAAIEVGLEVGEPGCSPNLLIVATPDGPAFTRKMVKDYPDAFAKYDSGIRRSRRDLDRFIASKAPVRWWHVTARTTADGMRYQMGDQVRVRDVSRIKSGTRDDFAQVIIIVDVSKVGAVRFATLADYLAMVGLAQIDPRAETEGVRTVLNLFSDREAGVEPAAGLTDWDKAYLKGLYEAQRDVRRGASQEGQIASTISRELTEPAEPAKAD